RGDCGVFSSGYWIVMFGRNANCRNVTARPTKSSVRKNVLKKLAGVFISSPQATRNRARSPLRKGASLARRNEHCVSSYRFSPASPRADLVVPEHAFDEYPNERDGNEDLPTETHDLIVSIARERRAEPEETEQEEPNLHEEPEEA